MTASVQDSISTREHQCMAHLTAILTSLTVMFDSFVHVFHDSIIGNPSV
jgi:hypothetical protein